MKRLLTFFLTLFVFTYQVNASCPEEQGRALAKKLHESTNDWVGIESNMSMIIQSGKGKASTLSLSSKSIKSDDGEKTLLEFTAPSSFKGTKLLSYSHINKPDEQWVHTGKTNKTKRIKGKARSSSFLGSQFSFEDLTSFNIKKYRYTLLTPQDCQQAEPCSRLESYVAYTQSAYYKLILWIDDLDRVQKVEYFDDKHEHVKTLTIIKHQQLNDSIWQPVESEMINHKNKKSTKIIIHDIILNENLRPELFKKI